MSRVGIASCAQFDWVQSSRDMVQNLANAVGERAEWKVHIPVDSKNLIACLKQCNYYIIHMHGSAEGFFDVREDGSVPQIVSAKGMQFFPKFPDLKLVVITACECAKQIDGLNIAATLSKHIAPDGLVIANRYVVFGANYDFGERDGKQGWVAYQNGNQVLSETDFPARITMADAFEIYVKFRKNQSL